MDLKKAVIASFSGYSGFLAGTWLIWEIFLDYTAGEWVNFMRSIWGIIFIIPLVPEAILFFLARQP